MDVELSAKNESFERVCKEIHDSCGEKNFMVRFLSSLRQKELREIRKTYTKVYGQDLVQIFQESVPFLSNFMLNPFERDAIVARQALQGNDAVDYKALMEIFTCRKSSHVLLILEAYRAKYKRLLDLDIGSIEPPHPFQKILMALSASHKAHNDDVSRHIAKCDARRLYGTGEGKGGGVDEAVVLEIFSKRSIPQLKLTFFSYKHIYGHSYTSFLKCRDSGEFEETVRIVAKCIWNPAKYYAKTLHGCLKGSTIDEGTLLRIMVEADMDEVQTTFEKKYGVQLKSLICERMDEGNHRDFLVGLATKAHKRDPSENLDQAHVLIS